MFPVTGYKGQAGIARAAGEDALAEATIRDVAREAAVSVASVSRVLSGGANVRPAMRARVQEAATRLGYVPHAGARMLSRRARTFTIGVILPDMHGEFFSELLRGMDEAASDEGLQLLLSTMHADPDRAARALRSMRGRVDGVAVMTPQVDADVLLSHLPAGVPALLINGARESHAGPAIHVDGEAGALAAVRHLIAGGRRRIVHVAGPADNRDAIARVTGYSRGLAEAGLTPRVLPGSFRQEAGGRAVAALLAEDAAFDAIFAANDQTAIGAMLALREAGLDVPGDVAVAGFDDIPLAALIVPGLTTMRADAAGIGTAAVRRLAAIAGGRPDDAVSRVVPVLVPRGSTDPIADPENRDITPGGPS